MRIRHDLRAFHIVRKIFTVVAIVMLALTAYTVFDTRQFMSGALIAEGTVTDLSESIDPDDNSSTWYPIVQFTARNDQEVEFRSNIGSNPPSFEIGDIVEVAYQPDNVESARVNTFGQLWTMSLILGFLSTIFGCFSFAFWYTNRK